MLAPPRRRPKVHERIVVAFRYDGIVEPVWFLPDDFTSDQGPRHAHIRAHSLWLGITEREALEQMCHRGLSSVPDVERQREAPLDGTLNADDRLTGRDLTLVEGSGRIRRPGLWLRTWMFPCCRVSYVAEPWTKANRHLWPYADTRPKDSEFLLPRAQPTTLAP